MGKDHLVYLFINILFDTLNHTFSTEGIRKNSSDFEVYHSIIQFSMFFCMRNCGVYLCVGV